MDNIEGHVVKISTGNIESSSVGQSPTILISHGTLGGFDQGLAIAQLFNQQAFRFRAVSRAGYLRSSPATGGSPEDKARSYVELLNRLGIASTAVIGVSGGASSAVRFAQDYPDRCWALVLHREKVVAKIGDFLASSIPQ